MAVSDNIARLSQAMQDFEASYKTARTKKAPAAKLADNAALLGGNTQAQVSAAMVQVANTHIADHGNPHHETAEQLNAYDSSTIDGKAALVPKFASFDVSRFGDLSFLPVGAAGSFQGASEFFGTHLEGRYYPLNVEDDGTLVFLRNGTDGAQRGVYYAYQKNVLNSINITPVRTNKKYMPTFFNANQQPGSVLKSDEKSIFGYVQDANGNSTGWFVALTNGTYDDTKHVGVFISFASMPQAGFITNAHPECFVINDSVVILMPNQIVSNAPFEFLVYRIPLTAFVNGATVVPTQVKGWSFKGLTQTFNLDTIRITSSTISQNASDDNLIFVDPVTLPSSSWVAFHPAANMCDITSAQDPVSGNIRTRVFGLSQILDNVTGITATNWLDFSFVWNINNQTGQMDDGLTTKGVVTWDSQANFFNFSGSVYVPHGQKAKYDISDAETGVTRYFHPSGEVFAIMDESQPDLTSFSAAAKVTNYTTKFAAIRYDAQYTDNQNNGWSPAFGSALGSEIQGPAVIPGGKLLTYSIGRNASGNTQTGLVLLGLGTQPYTYGSYFNGPMNGFSPTIDRKFITDMGLAELDFSHLVSFVSDTADTVTSATWFSEGLNDTGALTVDTNLQTTGSLSVGISTIQANTAQIMAQVQPVGDTKNLFGAVVVPQNPSIPIFGCVHYLQRNDANSPWTETVVIAELAIVNGSRTTSITQFSVVAVSAPQGVVPGATSISNFTYVSFASGGVTIYDGTDGWLVGFPTKSQAQRPGWSGGVIMGFAINKSTGHLDMSSFKAQPHWYIFDSVYLGAYPGMGFGYYDQSSNGSDWYTKQVFYPVAKNIADFKTWAAQPVSKAFVLAGQVLVQSWTLFLTDQVPAVLNGALIFVQPTNIDLTTIQADPSNSTFYVYLQRGTDSNGYATATYVVTTSISADTVNQMYLGYLKTDASSISEINIQKVSRVGKNRISTVAAGQAIPVSTGSPAQSAHLNWK